MSSTKYEAINTKDVYSVAWANYRLGNLNKGKRKEDNKKKVSGRFIVPMRGRGRWCMGALDNDGWRVMEESGKASVGLESIELHDH